ncbi:hypothetical protein [Colwellia sp. RSH04]|uniref:hypothetical protein n=1 Tax=Colwellia sp. RSH04 TaxID=2305464 RepID=UPI000E56AB36|nr:hypothetical protein [Colwellia sp. RSH04]RHW75164.1 hypothetical protein D1094_15000 [Colwellia sp. RSH04]
MIAAINNGYDLGDKSAVLLKAAIDIGIKDINQYMLTNTHIPASYTSRIIDWPNLKINWKLYGTVNDKPEDIMVNFIKSL